MIDVIDELRNIALSGKDKYTGGVAAKAADEIAALRVRNWVQSQIRKGDDSNG